MRLKSIFLCGLVLAGWARANENWPQWRGPNGDGSSDSKGLPTEWSLEKNIVWKTELPSWSGATPVVWGDRVFVTSASKAEPGAPVKSKGGGGSYGVSSP